MSRLGDFTTDSNAAPTPQIQIQIQKIRVQHPWTVRGTKKGSLPVAVESRRHGQVVVISNVEGNAKVLLKDVKKALGTGGVARPEEGYVEIQGGAQHETTVRNFLLRSGHVVGVNKESIQSATTAKKKDKTKQSATGTDGKAHLNAKLSPPQSSLKPLSVQASSTIPDAKNIKAMKPPELKAQLAARGLSTQGNKKELIARLIALKSKSTNQC